MSRGWAIDGAFDMLPWLSRRLDMPYVWGPAADSVWGNAVLSHFPIVDAETHPMPNNDRLRLERAFTVVVVDVGGVNPITVIATHLHHVRDEGAERVPQVQALLDYWDGAERTVLLGDLNALPDEPEIELLREAGLVDAFDAAGAEPPGYTSPAADPPAAHRLYLDIGGPERRRLRHTPEPGLGPLRRGGDDRRLARG